jgi:hypothetical protein
LPKGNAEPLKRGAILPDTPKAGWRHPEGASKPLKRLSENRRNTNVTGVTEISGAILERFAPASVGIKYLPDREKLCPGARSL